MTRNQKIGIIGLVIGCITLIGAFSYAKIELGTITMPGLFIVLGFYYLFKLDEKIFGKKK